jgi:RNA polymerase sigma-70 factor (ECF subfamily)
MATNVCLNRIRDRGRRPESAASEDEAVLASIASAESPGGVSDARMLLDWLFGRQPESSRTIAVLHYVDGLTLEEVARQTGLSVSGVRKRLRRMRHMLTEMRR